MANLARWSPPAASFIQGVGYCFLIYALAGFALGIILLAMGNPGLGIGLCLLSAVAGALAVAAVAYDIPISQEYDDETERTIGALGFSCAFFLPPLSVLLVVYLALTYLNAK